ncbi:hypothetical protein FVEG_03221 [Fusarium verticillioides 7600]|uniref:Uncharacterized protein n=1 Tax=Gibberella moniliformis (strain M3125 / FGSC 7600) TaxID=334819 RepID=W7M7Z8_GIBM7|nr:hypothetical protein FVEG_03221 [Fusarium verticillioides 7600]EWG41032.1 hypothetical protein FVEG_03221 [Fusarium verticillioides 7600]RBR03534.1 hypothetical protein FVER53590_03221 [Fusarium verticillioides]
MAAKDVPKWGFGQEPMQLKPVAPDFIPHFATTGDTRVDAGKTFLSFGNFAFKKPLTRPPAWERVPTQSLAAPSSNRQIMRRVTVSNSLQLDTPFVIFPNVSAIPIPTREELGFDLTLPRKVQRLESYKSVDREPVFEDFLMFSHAQHMHNLMRAKVHIANGLLETYSGHTREDVKAIEQGARQIVPVKRAASIISTDVVDTDGSPITLAPARGNRFLTYDDVLRKIQDANESGKQSVNLRDASITEVTTALQNSRRDPRKRLAALGEPELSTILDEEEPESPIAVQEPVEESVLFPGSPSPSKRLTRLITSDTIKKSVRRLSKLAKRIQGSPSKSSPSKSSPSKSSPSKSKHASSPLAQRSSPVYGSAAKDNMSTESVADSPARPGRTFRVPSECDSSSFEDTGLPETPNKSSSPVMNYSRPIAPTPSQWNRVEPSTPATPAAQSAPFNPSSPQQTDSPIGLAALLPVILPPATPKPHGCTLEVLEPSETFDFGKTTSFGSSNSWMFSSPQPTEPIRIKAGNQARRRRSEPLLRKFLDTRARRLSSSPQKVQFQQEAIFNDDISIASLFDITYESPAKAAAIDAADETTVLDSITSPSKEPAAVSADEQTLPLDTIMEESVATEADPIEAANETSVLDSTIPPSDEPAADSAAEHTLSLDTPMEESVASVTTSPNEPAAESAAEHTLPLDTPTEESVATDADPIEAAKPTEGESNLGYASVLTENLWMRDLNSSPSVAPTNRQDGQHSSMQPPTIVAETPVTKAPTSSESVVNIDVRENPDIFGTQISSPPAPIPIQNLSRMADDACNGHAKVVVTEENGRLFVRFKLSARYAHMFPASQGFNDSLSFSPSVDISTPRPRPVNPTTQTPDLNSFGDVTSPSPSVMQTPEPQSTESLLKTPDINGVGVIDRSSPGEFDTPELPQHDNTLVFGEPSTVDRPSSIRRTTRRQSEMTPLKRATRNAMGISQGPATPKFSPPAADNGEHTLIIEETPAKRDDETPAQQVETPAAPPIQEVEAAPAANNGGQDLDSPGRDYLRAFISQNRRTTASASATDTATATTKESSTTVATDTTALTPAAEIIPAVTTTETGSPIAPAAKRQPLGARSPNRGSPVKAKRKADCDADEESPAKKSKMDNAASEARGSIRQVTRKTKAKRQRAELAIDMTDLPSASTTTTTTDTPNGKQVDELAPNTSTRRSSRLRSQENPSSAPKSSLPTPIKLGRAGAGRSLPKKARSEEDELARKTRANTKRNMGKAEFPAEVLVRIADEAEKNSDQGEGEKSERPATGRRVGWNQPLEKVQGEEPKKGRAKGKATQGQTGISKPKAKRATKVAADLGMVANGTPAKPQRVTRSSARSGV